MTRRVRRGMARQLMPVVAVAVILLPLFYIQPRTMSYLGFKLLLNLAIPLVFATVGQMLIIMVNDLDLSVGAFVSMVATIAVQILPRSALLGFGALALSIVMYGLLGALIHTRRVPAIVVTLGMSYVWRGVALLILPRPGGAAPGWLQAAVSLSPPVVPLPIIVAAAIGLIAYFALMRSGYGVVLRGIGGNAMAVSRAGWSVLSGKVAAYCLAGLFGVLAGLSLAGTTTSADANLASQYTLLSIAGVILGGGDFVGGRISPVGAVLGAITMTLAGSFLSFVDISPDWQIGAQGIILVLVLAGRLITARGTR